MLTKPFPRVTGKFSIQRPVVVVVVVVSVSVHIRQTGPWGVRLSVCLLSLSHAGLELRDVLANPSQGSSQPQNLQSGLTWALSSSSLLLSSASFLKWLGFFFNGPSWEVPLFLPPGWGRRIVSGVQGMESLGVGVGTSSGASICKGELKKEYCLTMALAWFMFGCVESWVRDLGPPCPSSTDSRAN